MEVTINPFRIFVILAIIVTVLLFLTKSGVGNSTKKVKVDSQKCVEKNTEPTMLDEYIETFLQKQRDALMVGN